MNNKIVHTPYNEANNAGGLCKAEKELGLDSTLEVFNNDKYFDTADKVWVRNNNLILKEILRFPMMISILTRYNTIHYNFGSFIAPKFIYEKGKFKFLKKLYNFIYVNLFHGLDVKLAYFLRKKIVVTYQGSDARIISYCKKNYKYTFANEDGFKHTEEGDFSRKKAIEVFDKYATAIFAVNPDLLNTLPKRSVFIPYSSVQVSQIENIGVNLDSKKITFVHAPSNRIVKGTKYIISAIEKLKLEGYDIDLHLVEGMTNEQALEIYKTADVIIDQLLAGWYGAFAVECMSMGKPVVAYIRESDLRHVDTSMKDEIPIINSNPETIYKTVKSLVEVGKEKLYDIGQDSREFCLKWHEPKYIASQMKKIYGDRK